MGGQHGPMKAWSEPSTGRLIIGYLGDWMTPGEVLGTHNGHIEDETI